MDAATIIATIEGVLGTIVTLAPTIEQTGQQLTPFAEAIYGLVTGTNVTAAQLTALEAQVQALSDQLQTPLPPDDGSTTT